MLATAFLGWLVPYSNAADAPGHLRYVSSVTRDDMETANCIAFDPKGDYLYTAAWGIGSLNAFKRDKGTGALTHVQNISDDQELAGSTSLRVTPDGLFAVAVAFNSQSVFLYRREPEQGKLIQVDRKRNEVDGVTGLLWPTEFTFSPDSKFVYVADAGVRRGGGQPRLAGSVTAFAIEEPGKLRFIQATDAQNHCFDNMRGIAISPDGQWIAVTSATASTLVLLERDAGSGKTAIRQMLKDEEGGVRGLEGAFGCTFSPDGKFVYTCSGRFGGDNAVGVFAVSKDGKLAVVQEQFDGTGELKGYAGGNGIAVSADGRNVYVAGQLSKSVACFERDARTGKLRSIQVVPNQDKQLESPSDLGVSPDGKFVYVAIEGNKSISIFRRETGGE
ncbi:MAG: beta-propeller fold lactonase family protein [Verrucomicrobia bacterium]|nr:beta-propeller fold lactonase family protein [Verrucomicrobiota bacterium]